MGQAWQKQIRIPGIEQAGVAEAIVQAVQAAHPDLHPVLYGNISVCGGNALLPGFQERL